MDGATYTWDAKGNLLSDGTSTYTYNHANRLVSVVQGADSYSFAYNGLGDRLRQTVNGAPTNYALDMEGGLTQVLRENTNSYLYGPDLPTGQGYRIGEEQIGGWQYHLGDALQSSRQLVDSDAEINLARSFQPFGTTLVSAGSANSTFGFTGEQMDGTGLTYLRARYLSTQLGRFIQRDPSGLESNPFTYVGANPVVSVDPSGLWRWFPGSIDEDQPIPPTIYKHFVIENYYEGTFFGFGNPEKQLEYRIPGTLKRPDMFNSRYGDVYEIEPWFLAHAPGQGPQQAAGYVSLLLAAAAQGSLTGNYPPGLLPSIPFNWNAVPFRLGTGWDWPGRYRRIDIERPDWYLVADYTEPGLIQYWYEMSPGAVAKATAGVLLYLLNKRLVRPENRTPGTRARQPAYVISFAEVCGVAIVVVGGTLMVINLVENIATLGAGTVDDVAVVPAGLLFIDVGQRLGAAVRVDDETPR